jgi:putative ABC transport system substrate-binding protein
MRRRHLLAALGAGALTASFASLAQQPKKTWRVGVLSLDAAAAGIGKQQQQFLRDALSRAGFSVGKDLLLEWRFAEGKIERLPQLADGLVRLNVDVIVVLTSVEATIAAKQATRRVPIVMHNFPGDPLELGVVTSLAHPGGNVTGTTWADPSDVISKEYQILKEAAPATIRVASLWNPAIPGAERVAAAVGERTKMLGMVITDFVASNPNEIPSALERIAAFKPDALFVSTDAVIRGRLGEIAAFAMRQKLVTITSGLIGVREGLLLYYGPDIPHTFNRTASFVDRVLHGASPADLAVEQPDKYELVMNAKTAHAIGYKIPPALQMRINRVIE